jgi:hypothetical protein
MDDEQREALVNALMHMREHISMVLDTADSIRTDLIGKGWDEDAAVECAVAWLLPILSSIGEAAT